MLLAQLQEAGIQLSKDQLAILADTEERIDFGPDCDDLPSAQPSFMANISSSDLDVLSEVPHSDNTHNNMINQSMQAMPSSEQLSVMNHSETEITNNKSVNNTLTAELERYKEQVKVLKEGQNVEKARQLEPKLYDGNVIKNTYAIVIPDSEEALMLAEESRQNAFYNNKRSMNSQNLFLLVHPPKSRFQKNFLKNEPEHLKLIFKDQFDSIKKARVQSKEHSDSLIAQINAKSIENSDLNAQLQEKVFAIMALKDELRKLKGKSVFTCPESVYKPKEISPVVHKVDLEPLSLKLKNNREAHVDYIRITKENADTLRDIVEQARTSNPLDNTLAYALNDHARAKAVKSIKMKEWKPTGLGLYQMTPGYISSGLVQNPSSLTPNVPPSKRDWEHLFQPLFDEYFNPTPCVVSPMHPTAAPLPEVQSQFIHQCVEEQIHGHHNAQFDNAPLLHNLSSDPSSKETTLGKVSTEKELVLEQIQQGSSYEVSISDEGVKELKRNVEIKGEKKEALLTLRQKPEHVEFDESNTYVLERFDTLAGNPVKEILLKLNLPDHRILKDGGEGTWFQLSFGFMATCSYPTDKYKDIMKAQVRVTKSSATMITNIFLEDIMLSSTNLFKEIVSELSDNNQE
ncbi:hypothetical protein Tco_0839484 [Tanacetum coccineum]|uniref:Uncharacterized protein n=1 Tax=Tanacetum coccineum TaxID=301880 RepID=A0ABQ5ATX1_9ASTR